MTLAQSTETMQSAATVDDTQADRGQGNQICDLSREQVIELLREERRQYALLVNIIKRSWFGDKLATEELSRRVGIPAPVQDASTRALKNWTRVTLKLMTVAETRERQRQLLSKHVRLSFSNQSVASSNQPINRTDDPPMGSEIDQKGSDRLMNRLWLLDSYIDRLNPPRPAAATGRKSQGILRPKSASFVPREVYRPESFTLDPSSPHWRAPPSREEEEEQFVMGSGKSVSRDTAEALVASAIAQQRTDEFNSRSMSQTAGGVIQPVTYRAALWEKNGPCVHPGSVYDTGPAKPPAANLPSRAEQRKRDALRARPKSAVTFSNNLVTTRVIGDSTTEKLQRERSANQDGATCKSPPPQSADTSGDCAIPTSQSSSCAAAAASLATTYSAAAAGGCTGGGDFALRVRNSTRALATSTSHHKTYLRPPRYSSQMRLHTLAKPLTPKTTPTPKSSSASTTGDSRADGVLVSDMQIKYEIVPDSLHSTFRRSTLALQKRIGVNALGIVQ